MFATTDNMFISSLIIDKDGYIYFGTGEYFASPIGDNNMVLDSEVMVFIKYYS